MAIPAETIRTIDLGHEQMLIFEAGHQARVRVLYGATWLTEEGRSGDEVVRAGDELALHGGRALIEGLGPARVQIVEPGGHCMAQRTGDWLRRMARGARRRLDRLQLGTTATEGRA